MSVEQLSTLRIHLLSDLHLDFAEWNWSLTPLKGEADICILAGDISNKKEDAFQWLTMYLKLTEGRPIIMVLGNHDFYNSTMEDILKYWQDCELVKSGNVILLENNMTTLFGVTIAGCTLWTDMVDPSKKRFEQKEEEEIEPSRKVIREAMLDMNDYRLIKKYNVYKDRRCKIKINPLDTIRLHYESKKYLHSLNSMGPYIPALTTLNTNNINNNEDGKNNNNNNNNNNSVGNTCGNNSLEPQSIIGMLQAMNLSQKKIPLLKSTSDKLEEKKGQGPLIIVTHHLPTYKSVAPEYIDHPLNPCFASNADSLIETLHPTLWIHGHTHSPIDLSINKTRILCNPRGYDTENVYFNPCLIITLSW